MMDKTTRSAFAPPDVEQLPMEHAARQSSIFWGIAAGIAMIGIRLMAVFTPFGAGITLVYLITAGLGVYGITQLAAYINPCQLPQRCCADKRHPAGSIQCADLLDIVPNALLALSG